MERIEIYVDGKSLVQPLSSEDTVLVTEVRRAVELAERAGMTALAERDRVRLRPLRERRIAAIGVVSLFSEDQKILEVWLPILSKEKDWQQYNMNGIPFQVRELIVRIREAQLFDELLIRGWMERPKHSDMPRDGLALFGSFGDHVYLLARWTASWNGPEDRLPTLDEIRASVHTMQERNQAIAQEAKRVEEERNRSMGRMRDLMNTRGIVVGIGAICGLLFGMAFCGLLSNVFSWKNSPFMIISSAVFLVFALLSLTAMVWGSRNEAKRCQELSALQGQYPDIAESLRIERSRR